MYYLLLFVINISLLYKPTKFNTRKGTSRLWIASVEIGETQVEKETKLSFLQIMKNIIDLFVSTVTFFFFWLFYSGLMRIDIGL